MKGRKEENEMKTVKLLSAGLLLTGSMDMIGSAIAEDGVLFKEEVAPGGYCHMNFQPWNVILWAGMIRS
jgi:hypothetical protein